jgi:pentose-5-phosphate-3-epimerase
VSITNTEVDWSNLKYSVSVACLNQKAFEENVLALSQFPVTDLHCDYFPEIDTAESLSLDQIEWCQEHWPHGITVHVWGMDGVCGLATLGRRGRLLVQVHSSLATESRVASYGVETGWQTGVSLIPELVPSVLDSLDITPVAVQVLTTSTPGFSGWRLVPTTWPALVFLRRLRAESHARWTIEVDGGVTEMALDRLDGLCDLAVLGSNYLRVQPETEHRLPVQLWEKNCLSNNITN